MTAPVKRGRGRPRTKPELPKVYTATVIAEYVPETAERAGRYNLTIKTRRGTHGSRLLYATTRFFSDVANTAYLTLADEYDDLVTDWRVKSVLIKYPT